MTDHAWLGWLLIGAGSGMALGAFGLWWARLRPRAAFRESLRADEIAHAIDRARHGKVKEGSEDYALLGRLAKVYEVQVKPR